MCKMLQCHCLHQLLARSTLCKRTAAAEFFFNASECNPKGCGSSVYGQWQSATDWQTVKSCYPKRLSWAVGTEAEPWPSEIAVSLGHLAMATVNAKRRLVEAMCHRDVAWRRSKLRFSFRKFTSKNKGTILSMLLSCFCFLLLFLDRLGRFSHLRVHYSKP